MARTKIKSEAKQIGTVQKRRESRGKILMLLVTTLIIVGVFVWDKWDSAQEVDVLQLATNVTAGDMVEDSNLKTERVRKEQYMKDKVTIKDETGQDITVNSRVLATEKDKYLGQFYNYYQSENSSFTVASASKEMQYKNPLIEAMPEGNELYSLKIESEDLDINQLFPSTTLRMRISIEVPIAEYAECKRIAESKTTFDGSSSVLNYLLSKGYSVSGSGVGVGIANSTGEGDMGMGVEDSREQVVSEIILKDVIAVDMQSGSGESIYEVYMALMRMPVAERIPYLKTSFNDDVSSSFRGRVTPSKLDLDLTLEQATRMHEYEEMGYSVKYTIVKTDTSTDMLRNFTEINSQIVTQLNQAKAEG